MRETAIARWFKIQSMLEGTRIIRQQIVGTDLSAVTFVRDYVQLDFDGPKFNVLTPITVASSNARCVSNDDQFRNLLCGQIGKAVSDVIVEVAKSLLTEFDDGSAISVSLKEKDHSGPEAINFYGRDGVCVVV